MWTNSCWTFKPVVLPVQFYKTDRIEDQFLIITLRFNQKPSKWTYRVYVYGRAFFAETTKNHKPAICNFSMNKVLHTINSVNRLSLSHLGWFVRSSWPFINPHEMPYAIRHHCGTRCEHGTFYYYSRFLEHLRIYSQNFFQSFSSVFVKIQPDCVVCWRWTSFGLRNIVAELRKLL